MRIATAAYPIDSLPDWSALQAKLSDWIKAAGAADLLVFPEYGGLEAGLIGVSTPLSVQQETDACVANATTYWNLISELAEQYETPILAGSLPAQVADGRILNIAALMRPDGSAAYIPKSILTPWERANTPLASAGTVSLCDLPARPRLGVLICYDGEFPMQGRALTEGGAQILLMPSATEGMHGHSRVRLAARARALEGRAISVLSQLVGTCPMSAYADVSTGRAGLYAPPDDGWPGTGIITETDLNAPGWATATLPFPVIEQTRQVDIPAHWEEQAKTAQTVTFLPIGENQP